MSYFNALDRAEVKRPTDGSLLSLPAKIKYKYLRTTDVSGVMTSKGIPSGDPSPTLTSPR